jgi:hypothetical protein
MNPRIQELADQCYNLPNTPEALYYRKFDEQKFAELIYKQCRDIVGKTRDTAIEHGWNIDEAMSTAMYDIDEYFGVK